MDKFEELNQILLDYFTEDGLLQQTIAVVDSVNIIIHTKEHGHNEPHVHAQYQGKEVVISLITGEVLCGYINPKKTKVAKEFILKNGDFLIRKWNTITKCREKIYKNN